MFKVFVGGISPEGEHILTTYLNEFMPDAVIEPLKSLGIKGKIKNHAVRQDVALVILDESLWNACSEVASDVLSLPKVHKYVDDEGLTNFLISKFGKLSGATVVIPPDVLMQNEEDVADEVEIPKSADIFTTPNKETIPPDKIIEGSEGIIHTVMEDSYDNLSVADESLTVDEKNAERIAELEVRLAKSDLLVRNLTLQLEDKNSDDDIQAFIGRIRELEAQLEDAKKQLEVSGENSYVQLGKVARAEQVIKEFESLKEDLRTAKEEKSQLEYDKNNLTGQVELLHTKIEELKNQVAEIELLKEKVAALESDIEAKDAEIRTSLGVVQSKDAEIATLQKDLEAKNTEIRTSLGVVQSKDTEVAALQKDIESLQADITAKAGEIESLQAELSDSNELLETALNDIEVVRADVALKVTELESKSAGSDATIEDLRTQINSLTLRISELDDAINSRDEKITELEGSLEECQKELDSVREQKEALESQTTELTGYKDKVESLGVEITSLKSQIEAKDADITRLQEEYSESQTEAVDKLLKEKESIEDKLVDTETQRLALEGKVTSVQAQLDKANADITALESKRDELSNKIEELQAEAISNLADAETITRLEGDLLEERKKSAKLASEVEVYRKTDESSKTSELRLEVVRLKNELETAKNTSANVEELDICKKELQEFRERYALLELDMVEKDDVIKELESGVFGRLAGVAFSKAAFDVNLPSLVNIPSNFYCVACGSNESNLSLYQLLKKSCIQDTKKKVLILDLATDSYIDREFGIQKATSPVAWLEGSDSFKHYIAQTRYQNVRVLTTALSYLNDLSLLNVNWQKCLNDLGAFSADVVIVNIGCLNNVVTKILFNMFSKAMTSHVVVKATPINLRAVILNMTGFREVSHFVTVSCVGFDEKASRGMYQRLVAKYKAQILGDSDVLKL